MVEQVDYCSSKIPQEARLCLLPCCVDEDRLTCVAGLAGCARHLVQYLTPELSSLLVCQITKFLNALIFVLHRDLEIFA